MDLVRRHESCGGLYIGAMEEGEGVERKGEGG